MSISKEMDKEDVISGCDGWHTQRGGEELPHVRGQGQWSGGATPRSRPGFGAESSHPVTEARGGGREDQPRPRSGGFTGEGGPRGAIPR